MSNLSILFSLAYSLCWVPSLFQLARACTPIGVCGPSNPYCNQAAPGGYYQQQQFGQGCAQSCVGGQMCGPYGCHRMRAGAALSHHPYKRDLGGITTEESDLEAAAPTLAALRRRPATANPNRIFAECCMDRKLPDACLEKCNYEQFTRDAITRMYFRQDACPLEAIREIHFCAAQGQDHSDCCRRQGVTQTLGGEKCLVFCDQRVGRVTMLDLSYVPCYERFDAMKTCFLAEANSAMSRNRS